MAKTRAQRKAERRAREEQERKRAGDGRASEPEHSTTPRFRSPATSPRSRRSRPGSLPVPRRAASRPPTRRRPARGRAPRRSEGRQGSAKSANAPIRSASEREQLAKKQKQAPADRQRGGVLGFFASCWAELKKVQWPDRDTLVQATAVTVVFVTVAAAYLGALDALFNFLVKQIL